MSNITPTEILEVLYEKASQNLTKERARNNIPILAAFFSALLRYSSVT
jgi:hypothetical protein